MIRPFDFRDLSLIRRLSEQGVFLHTRPSLIGEIHPLRSALLSIIGGELPTFVWKADEGSGGGFIQLHLEKQAANRAHILYISPAMLDDKNGRDLETIWFALLDQAMVEVGKRKLHSAVVEIDETSSAVPVLRRAGFAIYTRQDIYRLNPARLAAVSPSPTVTLRQKEKADEWDIQLLYANVVPRLVQTIEPSPPSSRDGGWVFRDDGELIAYTNIHVGSDGAWLRLFMRQSGEASADELLTAVLQLIPGKETHPVYVCVRRYQAWQQASLERAGFELCGSQAVMVRHATRQARKKQTGALESALEAGGIPVSAPIAKGEWKIEN